MCVFRNRLQAALFKTGDKGQGQRAERNFRARPQVWVAG